MARVSSDPLQPNPFSTHRDPKTGVWFVIKCQLKGDHTAANNLESAIIQKVNEQSPAKPSA